MKLGEYIRQLRCARDLSLREFAGELGLSPAFISDIELGRRNPGKEVLAKTAKFFGISTEELEKYDERIPVETIKKIIQTSPTASAAVGILLRKAAEGEIVTSQDIKNFMNAVNHKKD